MDGMTKKFNKRLEMLRTERSSFIPWYQELSDYHLSHRGRFLTSDRNKGIKRNTKQINNTSRMAARTLASGMMAGITSPARPWFRLSPPATNPELAEYAPVKEWLHRVQQIMYTVFSHSNFYNSLHTLYGEIGVFGTASMGVYQDFNKVIWCRPETVGSYMLGVNGRDEIDTRYREYDMPVGSVVKEFGIDNVSNETKKKWESGNTEAWIKVVHVIEPNDDRDSMSPLARDKQFRSVYYEKDACNQAEGDKFLRRSGFDVFPIVAPRWDVTAGDIYGTDCPGMLALGDTKSLQLGERRYAQARDKVGNPMLQGPPDLRNTAARGSFQGSDVLFIDQASGGLQSVYGNWRPDLNAIKQGLMEDEMRIKRAFYEDLFLMISQSDRRQVTAREIAEKQEEKLLMLGPVLERLHTELLDPIIDRTFNILQQAGVFPPPPPELTAGEIKVEYVSVLAQAQRMVAVSGIEATAAFVGNIAAIWPEARHKIDPMQMVDDYSESRGVSPGVVRTDEEAEEAAAAEAQAQAANAAMANAEQAANVAKTASETDTSSGNALTDVMQQAGLA